MMVSYIRLVFSAWIHRTRYQGVPKCRKYFRWKRWVKWVNLAKFRSDEWNKGDNCQCFVIFSLCVCVCRRNFPKFVDSFFNTWGLHGSDHLMRLWGRFLQNLEFSAQISISDLVARAVTYNTEDRAYVTDISDERWCCFVRIVVVLSYENYSDLKRPWRQETSETFEVCWFLSTVSKRLSHSIRCYWKRTKAALGPRYLVPLWPCQAYMKLRTWPFSALSSRGNCCESLLLVCFRLLQVQVGLKVDSLELSCTSYIVS